MKVPSIWALLVLLVVVLVLFGSRKLPDIASSVGKSLKIFKRDIKDLTEDDEVDGFARQDSVRANVNERVDPRADAIPDEPGRVDDPP